MARFSLHDAPSDYYPRAEPPESTCEACRSIPGVPYLHTAGGYCFTCMTSPGGTHATPGEARRARKALVSRLDVLIRERAHHVRAGLAESWREKHGRELAALLARAPADVRDRANAALAKSPHFAT